MQYKAKIFIPKALSIHPQKHILRFYYLLEEFGRHEINIRKCSLFNFSSAFKINIFQWHTEKNNAGSYLIPLNANWKKKKLHFSSFFSGSNFYLFFCSLILDILWCPIDHYLSHKDFCGFPALVFGHFPFIWL